MTEKQIVEIRGMGHTIGSHGYFSYDLRFCDEQTVRSELSRSLEFLDRYPCLIKPIAYANGGYNKSVINHALRFGYTHGFGTQQAIGCPHLSMATPRIDPISAGF
jgi:peptidoglycan/xylan/chitin deacetylase (PgdA/CDA1 family)